MNTARLCVPLLIVALGMGCSSAESEPDAVATTTVTSSGTDQTIGSGEDAPERDPTTVPSFEPATLDEVLPVVCDFERYNGLHIKADTAQRDPAGYEQSLDTFVRLILGDRSLPTDESSVQQITDEQARCDALPNLTFANGSHPVGKQIEATVFRSLFPVEEDCSWERKDGDGNVVDAVTAEAGDTIEIAVEPDDRSVRIDGCGIFVAGNPPTER